MEYSFSICHSLYYNWPEITTKSVRIFSSATAKRAVLPPAFLVSRSWQPQHSLEHRTGRTSTWQWGRHLTIRWPYMCPPFRPKNIPFPSYLQHFRVTASHLHAICSLSEPQPSTCNLSAAFKSRKIPRCWLCTTCMLSTHDLYTSMYVFPTYIYIYIYKYIYIYIRTIAYLYTTHMWSYYIFIYYPLHAFLQPMPIYHS